MHIYIYIYIYMYTCMYVCTYMYMYMMCHVHEKYAVIINMLLYTYYIVSVFLSQ